MTADSDRELDARLTAAAGFRDEDLPALPDTLRQAIRGVDAEVAGPAGASPEPATVLAAQQLVDDAHWARTHLRRGSKGRRLARRAAPLLATAAVGITALVITVNGGTPTEPSGTTTLTTAAPVATAPATPTGPPADLGPLEAPPGGLALAAISDVSFPYSLASVPAGLTPVLSFSGPVTLFGYTSPAVWTADYAAADDPGFTFRVSPADPRIEAPGARSYLDAETTESSVDVDGVPGDLLLGDWNTPQCGYAPSSPEQTDTPAEVCAESFAQLTWQRADGMWLQVWGEDDWSTAAAVMAIGESIMDRPQPVPLQIGLAPAGWSTSGYENNTSLTLISDANPTISNRINVSIAERWRGETTVALQEGDTQGNPVESVTVNGQPGELVSVPNGLGFEDGMARQWILKYQLPSGLIVGFYAPDTLTRDQVVQIAAQVTYDL